MDEPLTKQLLSNINPNECITIDSSMHLELETDRIGFSNLSSKSSLSSTESAGHFFGFIYLDVNETRKMAVKNIITKNTPIPIEVYETLYTLYEDQHSVKIILTQAMEDISDPEFVNVVHEGVFELPKGRPAHQPIKARFRYTENATMEAEFLDVNSGRIYNPFLDIDEYSTTELPGKVSDFEIES